MQEILLRVLLVLPWFGIGWLVGRGINGAIDGWLVFALVIFFVPLAAVFNIITVVFMRGSAVIKQMKNMQNPSEKTDTKGRKNVVNVADTPWYDLRRLRS